MSKQTININDNDSLVSLKVYEPKQRYYNGKTLYIAVTKVWRDRVNGNSYFSAQVEDIENDLTYIFPFQYGYGDHSEHVIREALNISTFDHKKIRHIKQEGCLKKDVKAHGLGMADNYMAHKGYYYQD
jgi:hypothetical protein